MFPNLSKTTKMLRTNFDDFLGKVGYGGRGKWLDFCGDFA